MRIITGIALGYASYEFKIMGDIMAWKISLIKFAILAILEIVESVCEKLAKFCLEKVVDRDCPAPARKG